MEGQGEFDYHESRMNQYICQVTKILLEDKYLTPRLDNEFLELFIRGRKYDPERAAASIKRYFKFKRDAPECVENMYPSCKKTQLVLKSDFLAVFKNTWENKQILLLRFSKWPTEQYNLEDVFNSITSTLHYMGFRLETQRLGIICILDFSMFGWNHAKQYTAKRLQQMATGLQDTFPLRFKAYHIVNNSVFVNILYKVMWPFMKPKMRDRIYLHGHDMSNLHKFLSPDILPEFLGGTLPETDFCEKDLASKILKREDFFQTTLRYGYK